MFLSHRLRGWERDGGGSDFTLPGRSSLLCTAPRSMIRAVASPRISRPSMSCPDSTKVAVVSLGNHPCTVARSNLARRQIDSEQRLAADVRSLAGVTSEVRDLLSRRLDDHHKILEHEERIRLLEDRIADRSDE